MPRVSKGFERLRVQYARVLSSIDEIEKKFKIEFAKGLVDIGKQAVDIAKQTLKSTDHTQKYGDALVNEIGGDLTQFGFLIKAPYLNNTDEMRKQMYFAEYGAGIGSTYKKDNIHGGAKWGYYTTKLDKSPRLYRRDLTSGSSLNSYKFMRNSNAVDGRPRGANIWVGITNRSKPASYMKAARKFVKENAANAIARKIRFTRVTI